MCVEANLVNWDYFSCFSFLRQSRGGEGFLKKDRKILATPFHVPDKERYSYAFGAYSSYSPVSEDRRRYPAQILRGYQFDHLLQEDQVI